MVALQGRLSGEQLESLVQVATPDTDQQWASDGPGWSASSLRAAARNPRAVTTEEAVERDRRRELGFRWNEARGELRLWGRIPDVDGALVALALTKGADAVGPDADGQWDPFPTRCADVLVASLSRDLVDDGDPSRTTVVVHTPEAALARSSQTPGSYVDGLDTAVPVANETVRRVACDAIRQTVVEDARGVPIALGRRTRTVPAHLFRLLKHRDRHCRAPGCHRTRGLHAHHRVHWVDGGTTDLDNLILLCSRHHHLVHERGWEIRVDVRHQETVELRHRDGRLIAPVRPPPVARATRERFLVTTA